MYDLACDLPFSVAPTRAANSEPFPGRCNSTRWIRSDPNTRSTGVKRSLISPAAGAASANTTPAAHAADDPKRPIVPFWPMDKLLRRRSRGTATAAPL